jgi:hypothetical protein
MPQSSASVSALAAALAKAQVELTNPDKSLTGTLPADAKDRQQRGRTFRYASLAEGLDIVRKTLGRHEIATIQSTTIDRDSASIKLTTTLAHSSGEWIASDWPVCPLADLSTPHRMGSALTYARRYALFTLVGIAGEDDLDAPDVPGTDRDRLSTKPSAPPSAATPAGPAWKPETRKPETRKAPIQLPYDASLRQRDELMAEAVSLSGLDQIAQWAKRIIPVKNTLTADHARDVERSLEAQLARFATWFVRPDTAVDPEPGVNATLNSNPTHPQADRKQQLVPPSELADTSDQTWLATPDRSSLTFGHPPRRRNKAHLRFVALQPCLICSRRPSDPHHLRFAQPAALGRKVSDEYTVPLCRTHHRQLHRSVKERDWWTAMDPDVDPLNIAKALWEESGASGQRTRPR